MALSQFRKESNIMKKNVMMRAASALLVAVLLTTCTISGTFAKYTTSTTGTDSARVAYWGFDQAAELTINLFDKEYDASKADKSVNGAEKVIAPGTEKSTEFAFSYANNTGKSITAPEVDYTFSVSTAGSQCAISIQKNTNIKWYLDDELAPAYVSTGEEADTSYDEGSWNALLKAIEALDGDKTKYDAGKLPEAFYGTPSDTNKKHTIGWKWAFDTEDDTSTTEKNEMKDQDATDTAMGNADTLDNVTLKITITATQID